MYKRDSHTPPHLIPQQTTLVSLTLLHFSKLGAPPPPPLLTLQCTRHRLSAERTAARLFDDGLVNWERWAVNLDDALCRKVGQWWPRVRRMVWEDKVCVYRVTYSGGNMEDRNVEDDGENECHVVSRMWVYRE